MMIQKKYYVRLEEIFRRYGVLESINCILRWDGEVLMPSAGANLRTEQIAAVTNIAHSMIKNDEISELIKGAEDEELDFWQSRNLREMKRLHTDATIIDEKLQEKLSQSIAECTFAWRDAKKADSFEMLEPYLNRVIGLVREVASIKASFYGVTKYDALIDKYDLGRRAKSIDILFAEVEKYITQNIDNVIEKQERNRINNVTLPQVPTLKQKKLIKGIIKKLGFDFSRGRLDESTHPFCDGGPSDTRLTTRYIKPNFLYALTSAIHEAGHGIYVQNLPKEWESQPIGFYNNMTIHESQSLFYENQIGNSKGFIEYIFPAMKKHIQGDISIESIYAALNKVQKSDIRTQADEFTYGLHIIHRYKLEKALIEGDINTKDIPSLWNEEFYRLFGKKPASNQSGCLQDIHWPFGDFGYFPSYLLGTMFAAQLRYKIEDAVPGVKLGYSDDILNQIRKWLNINIHNYAALYTSDELIFKSCGEPLKSEYFIKYLSNKFDA